MFVDSKECKTYNSLADLCEEWEDYQDDKPWKPKDGDLFYLIETNGAIGNSKWHETTLPGITKHLIKIGNCFRTREEAEQVVEKLKAWRRLKDAGFEFTGWDKTYGISFTADLSEDIHKDLDLLFNLGGDDGRDK